LRSGVNEKSHGTFQRQSHAFGHDAAGALAVFLSDDCQNHIPSIRSYLSHAWAAADIWQSKANLEHIHIAGGSGERAIWKERRIGAQRNFILAGRMDLE